MNPYRMTEGPLDMARASAEAGFDAALTIAARAQRMMSPTSGADEKLREVQRMVQEKVSAAFEGGLAAQTAWASFVVKAAFGGVVSFYDVSAGFAEIAAVAVAPAQRAVRANARRLVGARATF
jgi:hypothetical protein